MDFSKENVGELIPDLETMLECSLTDFSGANPLQNFLANPEENFGR
jgi:hypothetical protein